MPTIHHPELDTVPLSAVLAALSDPTRLEIVKRLDESGSVGCVCADIGVDASKSALSHHFKVLRQAGVIHQEPQGTARITTLRREELDGRFPGLLVSVLSAEGPV
ncbi:MAG: metalloregulator ArsR/SmtB family transcription factor [Planctomycetota bacterium]